MLHCAERAPKSGCTEGLWSRKRKLTYCHIPYYIISGQSGLSAKGVWLCRRSGLSMNWNPSQRAAHPQRQVQCMQAS